MSEERSLVLESVHDRARGAWVQSKDIRKLHLVHDSPVGLLIVRESQLSRKGVFHLVESVELGDSVQYFDGVRRTGELVHCKHCRRGRYISAMVAQTSEASGSTAGVVPVLGGTEYAPRKLRATPR